MVRKRVLSWAGALPVSLCLLSVSLVICWCNVLARTIYWIATGVTRYRKRDAEQLEAFALWGVKLVKTLDEALKAIGAIA